MFIFAHIAMGLIIGKLSNNYLVALLGSLLIDFDHLIPYVKHNVLFSFKKFWKTVTNPKDPYGHQRNYFHSVLTWMLVSGVMLLIDLRIGLIFSVAYLCHLFLDMIDASDFYPLYPYKYNFIGPIKYLSKDEWLFTLALCVMFLII